MARWTIAGLALVVTTAVCVPATAIGAGERDVIVIGHRGASGERPEHTLASYKLAIKQCADYIEPDLVSTSDHELVARHENEITATTDVADHPEFADRQTTKVIDGISTTGWFTEDFTLAELETLRAKERIPDVRPGNAAYDGKFEVPTFAAILKLAKVSKTCDGRPVGVYPETKHAAYFDSIGLSLEEPLVKRLTAAGFRGKKAPVYIQSFEVASLQQLRTLTKLPLVLLVDCGQSVDLDVVATYADGIGPCKDLVIPTDAAGSLGTATTLVDDAHAAGLVVHPFTFRRENQFLPAGLRSSDDLNAAGDLIAEITAFLDTGIDGFFTDNPDIGRRAVEG